MRRTLVTGGAGQLGRAFARLYPDAVVMDRGALDITDETSIAAAMEEVQPEVLVNAAAYTAVDKAEVEPEEASRINVDAVIKLARACRKAGALLVQPSSDYVYAGDRPGGYTERDFTRPISVYGRTKLHSEVAARSAGGQSLILRTSWVFGDGKNFIRSIVGAARTHDSLDVVDDQRGRPTYAEDLANAIVTLVDAGGRGVYNVTGGGTVGTWADVAETAIAAAGLKATVRRVTTAQYYAGKAGPVARRPANSELNCSLAEAAGVSLRPWQDAVAAYVKELVVV